MKRSAAIICTIGSHVILGISSLSSQTSTQQPIPPKVRVKQSAQPSSPPAKTCFLNQPFDRFQEKVPKDYCGIDVKYLAKLITDSPLLSKRTEFETSAAYSARLSSFTQNPLAIGLLPTDVVAVVLKQTSDISVYEPLKVVYDADNQAFKLSLNFKKTTLYLLDGAPELASIIFENNIYDESKYPGRNAMGTTVEITEGGFKIEVQRI